MEVGGRLLKRHLNAIKHDVNAAFCRNVHRPLVGDGRVDDRVLRGRLMQVECQVDILRSN